LAGGFGTRLRPLSCTRPKMLFPLANQALLDWTLKNLSEGGVDTVVLAVNYMAEALVRYFGPTKFDLGIIYSREERPLGHGGPIKKAEDILRGDEPFLVLNGDIVSDIDYKRLVDFHKEKGGLATVALYQVHDPSRYGAVEIDGDGRIHRFVEKPEPGEAPSNLVNAGIYVFEPEVIDFIPPGRPVSTEREVFPILAEKGALYGFEIRGLWMDIGVPVDYLRANGKILEKMNGVIMGEGCEIDGAAEIRRPCCIGSGVVQGCRIENSIIFPGVTIGDYTSIRNALIGENATLERWVKVESGSIIGDYAVIADEVTITEDVSICPSKRVEESILEPRQVM
jgi:mannose-1-phosphate guanylyltransferase